MSLSEFIVLSNLPFTRGIILYWCLEKNEKRVSLAFFYTLIQYVLNYFIIVNQGVNFERHIFFATLQTGMVVLFCLCFCEKKFYVFIKHTLYIMVNNLIVTGLSFLEALVLPEKTEILFNQTTVDIVYAYPLLWIGVIVITYGLIKLKIFEKVPYILWKCFVVLALLGDLVAGYVLLIKDYEKSYLQMTMTIVAMCMFLIITTLFLITKVHHLRQKKKTYQELLDGEYEFYQNLQQQQMAVRKLHHDVANHIQVMNQLEEQADSNSKKEYQENVLSLYDTYIAAYEEKAPKTVPRQVKNHILTNVKKVVGSVFLMICVALFFVILFHRGSLVYERYQSYVLVVGFLLLSVGTVIVALRSYEEYEVEVLQWTVEAKEKQKREWEELKKRLDEAVANPQENTQNKRSEQFFTKDAILNAMLNSKYEQCISNGIQTKWDIQIPEKMLLEPAERVGLLSNLLDNAMEACEKSGAVNPSIHMSARGKANFWNILIQNSKKPTEAPMKRRFATSKKGDHGWGLSIVQSIVKKHDGILEFQDNGETFAVTVLLRVE